SPDLLTSPAFNSDGKPAFNPFATCLCSHCLQKPDNMDQTRQRGPDRHRDQAKIGAHEGQACHQYRHIRISPRCNQAKITVKFLPDMDVNIIAANKLPLDQPLQDIASPDHTQHPPPELIIISKPPGTKTDGPGPIPEGRVDQINTMIEKIAPPGRCNRAAGQLSIHCIEHHEHETDSATDPVIAVIE